MTPPHRAGRPWRAAGAVLLLLRLAAATASPAAAAAPALPPPASPPVPPKANAAVLVTSAAQLHAVLSDPSLSLPLSVVVAGDLLLNASSWSRPITWPPAGAPTGAPANLTLVLTGQPLPVPGANVSSGGGRTDGGADGAASAPNAFWRLPRFDLSNMQAQLQLMPGAVVVLQRLEVSSMTLGTWVDHETIDFLFTSAGAKIVFDNCLLHNTVCPQAGRLLGGSNAAAINLGVQSIEILAGGWCDPGAAPGAGAAGDGGNGSSSGAAGADVQHRCFRPAVRLHNWTKEMPHFGAIGGYTLAGNNTTLLCDSSVPDSCTLGPRPCFLAAMEGVQRGVTSKPLLDLAAATVPAVNGGGGGVTVSSSDGGGGGGGGGGGAGLVAGIVVGVVGGAAALLVLRRRAKLRRAGGKAGDEETGGSKGSRDHLAGSKEQPSSQPSSSGSNAAAASPASSQPPTAGGGGLEQHMDLQRQAQAPSDIVLGVLLGAGSYGRVYSGTWRSRPCAVKVLTHSRAETAVIEREVQVSLTCKHPNVVETMHSVRLDVTGAAARLRIAAQGGRQSRETGSSSSSSAAVSSDVVYETWLVQELCDGGALSNALYGGRFAAVPGAAGGRKQVDMVPLLSLALDVARGMAYLHSRAIIHSDLKAENVLLCSVPAPAAGGSGCGWVAKVADFGLSRALDPGRTHHTTKNIGTLTHMAPESLSKGVMRREGDVFSMGMIMWELYVGSRPYTGLSAGEVVHRVLSGARPAFPRAAPPAWKELAGECWAQLPEQRPSFEQVVQALQALLEQELLHAAAATDATPATSPARPQAAAGAPRAAMSWRPATDASIVLTSAAQLHALLANASLGLPLSLEVAADLLLNASNWIQPLTWPPAGAPTGAGANLTLVLTGRPLPVEGASAGSGAGGDSTDDSTEGGGDADGDGDGASAPNAFWRLPRFDLSNMQGRLQLAPGAVVVLQRLEVSGAALGAWVDHATTLDFLIPSPGATLTFDRCLLHNTVCPGAAQLLGGYTAAAAAAPSHPGGQSVEELGNGWCDFSGARQGAGAAGAGGSSGSNDGHGGSSLGGGGGGAKPRCYWPAVQLLDWAGSGQVDGVRAVAGGYTVAARNTTLLCDRSVPDSCTLPLLELAAATMPAVNGGGGGVAVSSSEDGGGGGGGGGGAGLVAGAVVGAVGGALLVAGVAALLVCRHRRRAAAKMQQAGDKAGDEEAQRQHPGGGEVGGSKRSRKHLAGFTGQASSQPSSSGSNALAASPANGQPPTTGGGGLEQHMDLQRQAQAPTDIVLGVVLGAGSYGRVYSGTWRSRPCAIKVLTHSRAETAVVEREVQVSLTCKHPNVVETRHSVRLDVAGAAARLRIAAQGGRDDQSRGTGSGSSVGPADLFRTVLHPTATSAASSAAGAAVSPDGVYETWLVQELCDGGALSNALYGGRFAAVLAAGVVERKQTDMVPLLSLALDVARGMAYLHSRAIIHSDLKAENVLLCSAPAPAPGGGGGGSGCGWVAKVADFGLSRALDPGRTHHTTKNIGTLTHMAPESLSKGVMRREGDVFAMAMIMWELYVGSRPYTGLSAGEVVHRVLSGARPAFPTRTPAAWKGLAEECWAQLPEQRPSFEQVVQALQALLEQELLHTAAAADAAPAASPARPKAARVRDSCSPASDATAADAARSKHSPGSP
ncbi:putative serine/threonine-protein kinase [Tetrabaena socialis]|uniref:Putative serine/threonine-protein kinase n=1 Tax=Tetrabaena socialis TaxID=47790 RepID=A0A2J8A1K3_9CHLO|nr:putative serine/threonine-protein kinase [Tetrabaena socialis]|eukprot:PNH06403.1 putative serine/threonine-protein kinase [Tetrabaena socialis]